jgi:cytochrome b involved in lipid metabolism
MEEEHIEEPDAVTAATIAINVIAEHNTEDDCWIVYEGKVYNYTDAPRHPNMDKVFFAYCGKISGFGEGAKNRHSNSNEDRVSNFGTYVGEVGK